MLLSVIMTKFGPSLNLLTNLKNFNQDSVFTLQLSFFSLSVTCSKFAWICSRHLRTSPTLWRVTTMPKINCLGIGQKKKW